MRIAIIGVGAMGCLFAARLSRVANVKMLGTWRDGVDAIRARGIALDSATENETTRVFATLDPNDIGECDLAIIARKSWQTDHAAEQTAQILARAGIALTLQNGLGNFEKIARAVGAQRAALGVTTQGAALIGPGHIQYAGGGATHIGGDQPALEQIVELFQRAGFETHRSENVQSLLWSKLAVNCGINALTAILRAPNGELIARADAAELMRRAARECAAVARARGIELPYADAGERAREVARVTARNRSSMFQDLLRGAPTEIEAINGAVAREGARLGVPTPTNEMLWHLMRAIVNGDESSVAIHLDQRVKQNSQ
ncbi:MAG: 2-dehydropantoate 2-reductase [Chloroflexi bacterium]|nr:2-dehydropantoate 2-reductase [Chloroflexota bacterium]